MRLDKWLVEKKIVSSRAKAKELINNGGVKVNGNLCLNAKTLLFEQDNIEIQKEDLDSYVSRSAHKLKAALDFFEFNTQGFVALDVGMSTGGFTQVLLEKGAMKVIGVDVGHGQLHPLLRNDSRVSYFEGINVREGLPVNLIFDVIVVDVSFISVKKLLTVLKTALKPLGVMYLLIKPQFEQDYIVKSKKLVLSASESWEIASTCRDDIIKLGFECSELFTVPLKGKEGNQEYVLQCHLVSI